MFICLKGLGKFRKSKAYGLVGCLTLSAVIGLAAPEYQLLVAGLFMLMSSRRWRYSRCGCS